MTKLMEKALKALAALPEQDQDAVAARILEEIEDERRWSRSFERSQDALAKLAARAREEIAAGKVREGDPGDR
jgi:hypothetical protein